MLVLITQKRKRTNFFEEDVLQIKYHQFLSFWGITAIPVPNNLLLAEKYFSLPIEGIILSGGEDVSPELYGGCSHQSNGYSTERDATEYEILNLAIKKRIKIFSICRGMQLLNVYFGGKLEQEVKNHSATNHPILITNLRAAAYFEDNNYQVNSFHHQGISTANLSYKLRLFAQSADGLVEGLYHPDLPIAGIQWHPERDTPISDINKRLIMAFINSELFWQKK